jgi:hypothetical protein
MIASLAFDVSTPFCERAILSQTCSLTRSIHVHDPRLICSRSSVQGCRIEAPTALLNRAPVATGVPHRTHAVQFFADAVHGDDNAAGTQAAPFQTVSRAVEAVRTGGQGGAVVLRAGVFHLNETLMLTAADSGLTIETFSDDLPAVGWLSGATPLIGSSYHWIAVNTSSGANIWSVDLSSTGITEVPALRWNGRRLWRARYPNGDPETTFPFTAELKASQWLPSPDDNFPPVVKISGKHPTASSRRMESRPCYKKACQSRARASIPAVRTSLRVYLL